MENIISKQKVNRIERVSWSHKAFWPGCPVTSPSYKVTDFIIVTHCTQEVFYLKEHGLIQFALTLQVVVLWFIYCSYVFGLCPWHLTYSSPNPKKLVSVKWNLLEWQMVWEEKEWKGRGWEALTPEWPHSHP